MKTTSRPRAAWHRITLGIQLGWAAVLLLTLCLNAVLPNPTWYAIHVAGLGLVGSAILVWTWHFADALTRSQQSQRAQAARLALLAAGVIQLGGALAITGGLAAFLAIAGAAVVVATISWHIAALRKAMSGSFLGRAAVTLRFHATAATFLVLGALIGVFMAVDVASRDIAMNWWSALYSRHDALALAHSLCQTLGFVGLTILGTLVTFGPTIARARMTPNAVALSTRALPCLAGAVVAGVVFSLLDMPRIAGLAVLAWVAAAVLGVLVPVAKSWKGSMPSVGDGWFVGAGITWIMVAALAWAVQLLASPDAAHARTGTGIQFALLIGAGAVQTVVGSLAFLLPVVLGGGPARLRRTLERIEPSAAARWFLVNGGVAVALATPSARTRTAALAIACVSAAASVALVAFHSLRQRSLDVEETPPPPEGGPRKLPRTRMALGASLASIALVVAVAAGVGTGSATDPAVEADAPVTKVEVSVRGLAYSPSSIDVPAGNRLVVTLKNTGDQRHDLVFANGAGTGAVEAGESGTVDVGVVKADTEGWCTIVGHRQAGMVIKVKAVGASGTHASGGGNAGSTPAGSDRSHSGHGGASHGSGHAGTGEAILPTAAELSAKPGKGFSPSDPVLRPAGSERVHNVTFEAKEVEKEVAPGRRQKVWTFNGASPGPILRGKVGDTFNVTLVNKGTMGHSLDFHAGDVSPDSRMKTIAPGQSLVYTFTAKRAGIWLYHCSTAPLSVHIASGMHGAVVIDPEDVDPVDREFVFVQSEHYWARSKADAANADAIARVTPSSVSFNGYPFQYVHRPIKVRKGERVRIWAVSAGPNLDLPFHVVGTQFDTVWYEGRYSIRRGCDGSGLTQASCDPFAPGKESVGSAGSQGLDVSVAQGGFVEFVAPEAGTYTALNHAMTYAERGATAKIVVSD